MLFHRQTSRCASPKSLSKTLRTQVVVLIMPFLMPRSKALALWQQNKHQQTGVRIEESTQKFAMSPRTEVFFCIETIRLILVSGNWAHPLDPMLPTTTVPRL